MAERANTRSSTRRNTPQSPTEPNQRNTRMTRSQSRDLGNTRVKDFGMKGNGRGVRGTNEESVGKQNTRGGQKRTQATRLKAIQDLPTVVENPSVSRRSAQGPDLVSPLQHEDTSQQRRRRGTKSPGGFSAISGTTARTSRSAEEFGDMESPVEMVDTLKDLSDASDRIADSIVLEDASKSSVATLLKSLQDPVSRQSKKLKRLVDSFQRQKSVYGSELPYINVPVVIRAMLRAQHKSFANIGNGPWRADTVLYKANVMVMLADIFAYPATPQAIESPLEKLERDFPSPFLSSIANNSEQQNSLAGCSALTEETFLLALDVRTQYCIFLLNRHHRQPNFDPDEVLAQVFLNGAEFLKGWDVRGMRSGELEKRYRDTILGRVDIIKGTFPEDSHSLDAGEYVDISRLKSTFPWSTFVTQVASWGKLRLSEINSQISLLGGISGISNALEKQLTALEALEGQEEEKVVESIAGENLIDYNPPSDITRFASDQMKVPRKTPLGVKTNMRFDSPVNVSHFKMRREAAMSSVQQPHSILQKPPREELMGHTAALTGPSAQTVTPSIRHATLQPPATATAKVPIERAELEHMNDRQYNVSEGIDVTTDTSEDEIPELYQVIKAQEEKIALENNKENVPQNLQEPAVRTKGLTFLDRQAAAERVPWDSQHSSQDAAPTRKILRIAEPETRREYELDQIGEVSEDEGFQHDDRTTIPRKSMTKTSNKRRAPVTARRQRTRRVRRDIEDSEPSDHDLESRGASSEANSSSEIRPSQAEIYRRVNSSVKALTADYAPKKLQIRKPWTDDETQTLIEHIELYGTSWTYIKKMDEAGDNILERRDQVALKDKARNMKFDYLKACHHLPQNFNNIALNQAQKSKLQTFGVPLEAERRQANRFV